MLRKTQGMKAMFYIIIVLLALLLGFIATSIYLTFPDFQSGAGKEVRPLSSFLLGVVVVLFVGFIVATFFNFVSDDFSISNNLGQVGDFIGGLTNPVLSFLALLALLRTTQIQTSEAKKTTSFMARQQELMEREKFETTFFQLLDRLEKYCDDNLRVKVVIAKKTKSVITDIADKMITRREEFDGLSVRAQLKALKQHIFKLADNDLCICFMLRAVRVLKFVEGSAFSMETKSAYVELLRDTMLPDERVVLSSYAFFLRVDRNLIKKWKLGYLTDHAYASKMMFEYYERA
jgi:hypothetical protein